METSAASEQRVRFKAFELNLSTGELSKHGLKVRLQGHPLDVLAMLLQRPGALVSRDALKKKLWPKETFVDFEHGLNVAISRLREALGDNADAPNYIETIPRLGYRFIAPVKFDAAKAPAQPVSPKTLFSNVPAEGVTLDPALPLADSQLTAATTRPSRARRWSWAISITSFTFVVLGVSVWHLRQPLPLPPLRVTEYTQITHDGRPKVLVGTDGVNLFLTRTLESQRIAQVATSGGEIVPIPVSLPRPWALDFSPDKSALLIYSYEDGQTSLWSLHIPGTSLRHLVNIAGPRTFLSAAWSPDGKYVAYGPPNGDIRLIRSDGSEDRVLLLAQPDPVSPVTDLAWSPDGRTIRFARNQHFWEMFSSGERPHPMLPGWRPGSWQCCGQWTPNGEFFVFLSRDELFRSYPRIPGNQVWALDERHRFFHKARTDPIQLTASPVRWGTPIPSRDGKRIFARGVTLHGELVRLNTKSHQLQPYLGGISAEHVAFSRDGRFMTYVTFPEGILWRANRDGSNPVQLTSPPFYPKNPCWSPDGTQILFHDTLPQAPTQQMYLIPSQGGAPEPIVPAEKYPQGDPTWSPDGRRILFSTGSTEAHDSRLAFQILDLASHQTIAVPGSEGAWSPRWSPDGRNFAGMKNGTDLVVFDSRTQRWSLLVKGDIGYPTWSRDGKFLYFVRVVDNPGVFRIRPTGGAAERIIDLKGFRFAGMYDIWMGLDPDDTPMLLRDAGTDDIFGLNLEQK